MEETARRLSKVSSRHRMSLRLLSTMRKHTYSIVLTLALLTKSFLVQSTHAILGTEWKKLSETSQDSYLVGLFVGWKDAFSLCNKVAADTDCSVIKLLTEPLYALRIAPIAR